MRHRRPQLEILEAQLAQEQLDLSFTQSAIDGLARGIDERFKIFNRAFNLLSEVQTSHATWTKKYIRQNKKIRQLQRKVDRVKKKSY